MVVTIGYRLGALGLLHAPESCGGTNFSLHDQIAALRWIRDNIAEFGGDPARVTIATTVHDAWVRFVHGEAPGRATSRPGAPRRGLFDTESAAVDDPNAAERLLWAG